MYIYLGDLDREREADRRGGGLLEKLLRALLDLERETRRAAGDLERENERRGFGERLRLLLPPRDRDREFDPR